MKGIYVIEHRASSRLYVGSAERIDVRWRRHLAMLKRGVHHNPRLQRAWNKYGADAFEWHVLVEMPSANKHELIEGEARVKAAMIYVYNVIEPGVPPMSGRRHTAESIAKMSESAKRAGCGRDYQRLHTPEVRAKIRAAHLGMRASPETRAKMSATHKARHQRAA